MKNENLLNFVEVDLEKHRDVVVKFRKDSFSVSFSDTSNFDEQDYLSWLEKKINTFPKGIVLAELDGQYIGQLELSIREYHGRTIGYIHLIYLTPEIRGKNLGMILHKYAIDYFISHQVEEYHLRVAPTNTPAIKFYQRIGMKEMGLEVGGQVIRMKGHLIHKSN